MVGTKWVLKCQVPIGENTITVTSNFKIHLLGTLTTSESNNKSSKGGVKTLTLLEVKLLAVIKYVTSKKSSLLY